MPLNFPWFNQILGETFGNAFDNSPSIMKIFFVNLNIGSTYAAGLGAILLTVVLGFSIISICAEH